MKTDSHLPQFADLMSEYVNLISGIGKCDYITRIYLNSFAKYCMNHGGVLSDDIISGWASRTDKESYYTNRNRCIILRRFIRYIPVEIWGTVQIAIISSGHKIHT